MTSSNGGAGRRFLLVCLQVPVAAFMFYLFTRVCSLSLQADGLENSSEDLALLLWRRESIGGFKGAKDWSSLP